MAPLIGLGSADDFSFLAGLMPGKQGFFKNKTTLDAYIGPTWIGAREGFALFGGMSAGVAF